MSDARSEAQSLPVDDAEPTVAAEVEVAIRPVTGLGLAACRVPTVDAVRVHNRGQARITGGKWVGTLTADGGPAVGSVSVTLSVDVPVVHPGDTRTVGPVELQLPAERLAVSVPTRARIAWSLGADSGPIAAGDAELTVLPWDEWPGERGPYAALAAFVVPGDAVVRALTRRATGAAGASPGVIERTAALFDVIRALGLRVDPDPADVDVVGARIRRPGTALAGQRIAAVELALLFAACLERMGLGAVIVRAGGRWLGGVWLTDDAFPETVVADADRLRPAVVGRQLVLFDPSVATTDLPPGTAWDAAVAAGWDGRGDLAVRFALDLRPARADGWRPLDPPVGAHPAAAAVGRPIVTEVLTEASTLPIESWGPPSPPASPAADDPVAARFRHWRDRLLDLSLRNRLLAFRMDARTTVALDTDLPMFVGRLLADTVFRVSPVGPPAPPSAAAKPSAAARPFDPEGETITMGEWSAEPTATLEVVAEGAHPEAETVTLARPVLDDDPTLTLGAGPRAVAAAQVDGDAVARAADLDNGVVWSPMDEPTLLARVVALDRATRLDLEEGGANTLYAAVGFLRWSEVPTGDPQRMAPLLLIPVVLDLTRSLRRVRIRRAPFEPVPNVTLIEKLRRDFDVDLSALLAVEADDGGPLDLRSLLDAAAAAVGSMPGWRIEERVVLGQLLFAKFLMWRDLEDNADWLLQSSVVQHIARRTNAAYPNPAEPVDPALLDDEVGPGVVPLVLDADSTQVSAVVAALRGRNFVLQGPPGTGKSQTIVNLVGAAIATGRTVLVVAEKMAALDVVHRRLRDVGLGDACLELHSHKANKRQVVAALAGALRRDLDGEPPPWDARSEEVGASRAELNGYVRALHRARPLGITFYAASAAMLAERERLRVSVDGVDAALDEATYRGMSEVAGRFATAAAEVEPVASHPWRDTALSDWSNASEQALLARLTKASEAIDTVEQAVAALAELLAVEPPTDQARARDLAAVGVELAGGALPRPTVDAGREAFAVRARAFARDYEAWQERSRSVVSRWHPPVYKLDLERIGARFERWRSAWAPIAWLMLYFARRELRHHARSRVPDNHTVASDLADARIVEAARAELGAERKALITACGGTWSNEAPTSDLIALVERSERLHDRIRAARLGGIAVPDAVVDLTDPALPPDKRKQLERRASVANRSVDRFGTAIDGLWSALSVTEDPEDLDDAVAADDGDGVDAEADAGSAREFVDVRARCDRWRDGSNRLRGWALYGEASARMREVGLGAIVDAHFAGRLTAREVAGAVERSVLLQWLEAVRDGEPALRRFSGPEHHRQVHRFRQLDRQHLALGPRQVGFTLAQRVPRVTSDVADASEPGILLREAAKKTRQKSIRRLFSEIPNLLSRLKPCLLMSPLSVAQYLPAGARRFDLVVFDEASQIGTHDAIGALARGTQVVVVGDSRQLPPTTFFQRQAEEGPDDNDFDELESILDEAVASGIPEQLLGWHYRSRHESLIRFSNDHYYDGRLAVFPAAAATAGLGIAWHHVPNGVYDKSRTRTNRIEAKALVDHLVASLAATEPGARTFGVVTFSSAQQALVSDLLDEARRMRPSIERHFGGIDEPVFVKNLENVQGDERDEVLFSIGYGPDDAGRLWMNFGPLNRDGGERRLNVAVTRARRQLRVFSTVTHDQIDLARTRARGARHLKDFLRYAEAYGRTGAGERVRDSKDFGSAFERQVCQVLRGWGYAVEVGVGCGSYRVDLAVVDPEAPDTYLLGVELDGVAYASGATARDRDRLRPEVLEGLGWRLFRMWSSDWWFDRDREVARLQRALEDAASDEPWADDEPTDDGQPDVPDRAPAFADAVTRSDALDSDDADDLDRLDGTDGTDGDTDGERRSDGERLPAWVEAYVEAQPEPRATDPKTLHAAEHLDAVREVVQEVIDVEAPVHAAVLTRRVGAAFGVTKLTAKAQRRVLAVAKKLAPPALVRGDFVWRAGEDPDAFDRVRSVGGGRDAEHVPPEEVAEAARRVLAANVALPHADLVRETARAFGIARLGRKINEAMADGIALLIDRGGADVDGDRIVTR